MASLTLSLPVGSAQDPSASAVPPSTCFEGTPWVLACVAPFTGGLGLPTSDLYSVGLVGSAGRVPLAAPWSHPIMAVEAGNGTDVLVRVSVSGGGGVKAWERGGRPAEVVGCRLGEATGALGPR